MSARMTSRFPLHYGVSCHTWGWLRIFSRVMLVLLGFFATSAYANSCKYQPSFPSFITGTPTMSGSITVGRDVPVGTVVYRATFWSTATITLYCEAGAYTYEKNYRTLPYPVSGFTRPDRPGLVYQTSIPGLGVQIWSNGPGLPAPPFPYIFPIDTTNSVGPGGGNNAALSFDVEIIKISNTVGAGTLRGSDLPTVEFGMRGSTFLRTLSGSVNGAINIVSRTCRTPDVTVDLGTHATDELTGVGSTTKAWVSVPVQLINCPAFFGYNATRNTNGTTRDFSIGANSISFNVQPTTPVAVASEGVMALRPDGVNPTATGVGIQMADSSGTPIKYGENIGSGLTLNTTDGSNYTIPLKARYYQTAAKVTAGQANGEATVTLIYN